MNPTDLQDQLQQALGAAYVIERELGGGGMSRVFVAHEAALGRKVVVKVLRPELAEGLSTDRFKREVRLAARLQHPHIVPLLAAGEMNGGVLFYTMPLVDGESLRARLAREGALPIAGAVRILCDVAGALAYAHRIGVVHRDVKPENILLSDGGAVVADFGIAKAISASREGDGDARRSSTLTAVGTSLGTPAYMAPEQATGDVVDHRADLYALGVVGYEMLAGWAPFEGRTAQQLLAAHATETPEPITRRRASVPPRLAALIMRLLEKNPADRPQSADDLRRVLDELPAAEVSGETQRTAAESGERNVSTPRMAKPVRALAPWALLGGLVVLGSAAAAGALLSRSRQAEPPRRSLVAALPAPAGQEFRPEGGIALSLDGRQFAFVAADRGGATAVWVRSLDSLTASRVDGTETGSGPFWSPDGGALGYFAKGQLWVADLRAGTQRALCTASRPGGGTWTRDGVIVYSPDFLSVPLFKVPAAGGPCTQLTRFRPGESVHRRPSALPDGGHVLFSSGRTGATTILAADLVTGTITDVRRSGGDPQFIAPDWILFREGTMGAMGPLMAQRLDLKTLRPIGEPRVLLEHVVGVRTLASYAASANALVAFQMNSGAQSLAWLNRQSVVVDSVRAPTGPVSYFNASSAALAHSGRRIAFAAAGQLWLYDRNRQVATRAHTGIIPGQGILEPAWGPGDSLIAYRTLFSGPLTLGLYHVATDTSDSLFSSGMRNIRTPDWSPDGRKIAFQLSAGDSATKDEIWIYSLAERRAARVWDAPGNLSSPRWSPDGRWMAYVSDETGAPEVYIRAVSGSGIATRVSTAGGEFPVWRADGRELYYRVPDGSIMGVGVKLGPPIDLSQPGVALPTPPFSRMVRSFDVTPDGQRFVGFGREDPLLFTLVLDWPARLPAR
ncbi:MAG TPA: protein kinase [Gemmatimonadales bacterium]|jgi:serine/threonine-protein kinase|nr:protein kinase [Gemmatimonadales bacterium]